MNIVIYPSDKEKLEAVLSAFIEESGSRLVMLVDKGGSIISRKGDFTGIEVQALSALTAGSFASTQALAKAIGEKEFTGVLHQGKRSSIYISNVAENGIIVAVFDVNTTVGMVRLCVRETSKRLEPLILQIVNRGKK
ncbi:roadblock/LC7 domain-containing protein [bacterium]|nr:roadblock/LC7 domain-containing protein [bacterium]